MIKMKHTTIIYGFVCAGLLFSCQKTDFEPRDVSKYGKGGKGGGKVFKRQTITDADNYIEYRSGNFPLILSAPHGGKIKPAALPDRTCADCIVVGDANTDNLIHLVDSFITVKTGCYPHAVFANLHRIKLDANRSLPEATDGNAATLPYYNAYHQHMTTAQQKVMQTSSRGLVIDLHGHGHSIQRLELGYTVSANSLRLDDASLAAKQATSSIRRLADIALGNPGFVSLIRGHAALGTHIANLGYPAVPSLQEPYPLVGEDYFSGGFITETYGSEASNTTDAIQIECNSGVRSSYAIRVAFADKLTDALLGYMGHYFGGAPSSWCQ